MNTETSLSDAKPDKLFYVVANALLVNVAEKSCLLLKRSSNEKEAAEKWAFPGGKGEHIQITNGRVNNFFGIIALAECTQETGLRFNLTATKIIDTGAFIRNDGIPVVWATLAAPFEGGEIALEIGSFSEYGWFNKQTLPSAEACIGSVRAEAEKAINILCAL